MIAFVSACEATPSEGEAVTQLQNGKAPGIDCITAELLKADMELSTNRLHQLLKKIWEHDKILLSWKRGLIIRLAE